MRSLLSRLFGTGGTGEKAAEGGPLGTVRTPCSTCSRQILPGSHCPFCQSQSFCEEILTTLRLDHAPEEKIEALGGVIVATEAARQYVA
jgi:hypothetical protein